MSNWTTEVTSEKFDLLLEIVDDVIAKAPDDTTRASLERIRSALVLTILFESDP